MSLTYAILIVASESNLNRSLALILRRGGYRVTMAGSAEEAGYCLQAGSYDLVLLDPDGFDTGGASFFAALRSPSFPKRVLLLTADRESADEAWWRGGCGYLLKPVQPECLLRCVHELLTSK